MAKQAKGHLPKDAPRAAIDWQTIDSAPKDGTVILLYPRSLYREVYAGWWRTWQYLDWECVDENTKTKTKTVDRAEWCFAGANYGPGTWEPTHWAPYVDLWPS